MADFLNLDSRQLKLQKEQEKRRQQARRRIERVKKNKEAAALDQAKIEEHIRQRKQEQLRREEEERKQQEAEQMRTGGIRYKESLLPVPAEGEGDKVLLPPSALDSLSRQDAVSMGPMLFELTCGGKGQGGQSGASVAVATTHAGVLEFVAAEGTIGLPRKVILSLLGEQKQALSVGSESGDSKESEKAAMLEKLGNVTVRYVRLAKAKFAKFVPETVGLSQVSELRAMLEHNMRNHASLTVGDRLSVWQRGKEFSLKVVELKPEAQVTLIDTDMEIDLDLPDEAREQLEAKGAKERAQTLRAHMDIAPSTSPPSFGLTVGSLTGHSLSPTAPAMRSSPSQMDDSGPDSDSDAEGADESNKILDAERHRMAKLEGLPAEPSRDCEGVFTCQLRSSEGKFARRFRFGDDLGLLFDFAEAYGGVPGHYQVVMPFPRKVLKRDDQSAGITMKQAGLTSKQEAIILEKF